MQLSQKKKIIIITALLAAIIICISVFAADKGLTLKFCSLTEEHTSEAYVSSEDVFKIDGNLLVPLRTLSDGIGTEIEWNTENDYGFITMNASQKNNAEKLCDQILTSEKSAGAQVTNKSIRLFIPTDSCNAKVYYDYTAADGSLLTFEKSYQWHAGARIFNNTTYVPIRCFAEAFGLEVSFEEKDSAVSISLPGDSNADNSSLSSKADAGDASATSTPFGIITETVNIDQAPSSMVYTASGNYTIGEYLGRFKITHYCTCSICNEGYGNATAYGGRIRPGITIAVDPSVIKKLSWVYIDGYGVRLAEDVGGAIKGNHIDMAVADHSTAMAMGVKYCDVWCAALPESAEEEAKSFSPPAAGSSNVSASPTPSTEVSQSSSSEQPTDTGEPSLEASPQPAEAAEKADSEAADSNT